MKEEIELKEYLKTTEFPRKREGETIVLKNNRILGYMKYGYTQSENTDPNTKILFFCHGTPGSRFYITKKMEKVLEQNKILCYIIERPGFGLSTHDKNRDYITYKDDFKEFLQQKKSS